MELIGRRDENSLSFKFHAFFESVRLRRAPSENMGNCFDPSQKSGINVVAMNWRVIRSYVGHRGAKIFVFGFIVIVVMLSLVIGRSFFDLTKANSAEMCHPEGYTLQIIDESVAPKTRLNSIESVNDPHFRSYIASLAAHVSAKFEGSPPCQGQAENQSMLNLVFVRLPLVTSGDESIAPPPSLPQEGGCRLESPWAKLLIRPTVGAQVNAVFIWNERQFLVDQMLISGKTHASTLPLMPIPSSSFEQYAQAYANAEILPEPNSPQSDDLEKIPDDLLWLFRHGWQSTRGPFSGIARSAMKTTLERSGEGYTRLAIAIFDQCFACQHAEQHYNTILDIRDVAPIGYPVHVPDDS
jgi:hypothetical protein